MKEKPKSSQIALDLNVLRVLVGFLGLRKQHGWWDCDFFDATGLRFLETIFPRTARQAALRSTTEAASRVHDQALGKIGSYHLFRLPVAIEESLESAIDAIAWEKLTKSIQSRDSALAELNRIANALVKAPQGPVQVGVENRILTTTAVQELAAHYHSAFQGGIRCFPYFSAQAHGR